MTGWELTELKLAANGRTASAFQFEIASQGGADEPRRSISGDGVVFEDGRVRFNREPELRRAISGTGLSPEECLSGLSCRVVEHALGARPAA